MEDLYNAYNHTDLYHISKQTGSEESKRQKSKPIEKKNCVEVVFCLSLTT
jgi:hypothetical protein